LGTKRIELRSLLGKLPKFEELIFPGRVGKKENFKGRIVHSGLLTFIRKKLMGRSLLDSLIGLLILINSA